MDRLKGFAPHLLGVLRIIAALLFLEHGLMKLFHFPAPFMEGSLPPLMMAAGIFEVIGGALLVLGLFTRWTAFILSGEMAAAYFMVHFPNSFWPAQNGGDAAILFCFLFLYIVAAGPGAWSIDAIGRRDAASEVEPV